MERHRIPCVGGIVVNRSRQVLLVLRGNEPARGCWSVPGGRKEPGESDEAATAREVLEETGIPVRVGNLVGTVEIDAPDGSVYVVNDYLCWPAEDSDPDAVRPGDDADDAAWYPLDQIQRLRCSPGLLDAFERWQVL